MTVAIALNRATVGGHRPPLRFDRIAAGGHEQVARFLTKQRNAAFAAPGLIICGIKLLRRQLLRRKSAILVASPQDRAEATGIGTTEVSDNLIELSIGNLCGHPIHPALAIQRYAQRCRS